MAKKKRKEKQKKCFMYLATEGDIFHAEEREQKQYKYIMEYAKAHNVKIVKVFHKDVAAQPKLTLDNDTFENTGKSRFFERRTSKVLY